MLCENCKYSHSVLFKAGAEEVSPKIHIPEDKEIGSAVYKQAFVSVHSHSEKIGPIIVYFFSVGRLKRMIKTLK